MSAPHLNHLAQLIGNDSHAASFQSLGQYRQALLKEITQASAAPEQDIPRYELHGMVIRDAQQRYIAELIAYDKDLLNELLYAHADPSEVVSFRVSLLTDELEAATQRADAAERKLSERYANEDWGVFAGYLIDKCEGHEVAEENLQFWFRDMLDDPHYGALFRREKQPCQMPSAIELAIEAAEEEHGSLRAAAKSIGVDAGYLSRLKSGDKVNPSDEVLAALGLERTVTYRPLLSDSAEPTPAQLQALQDEQRPGIERLPVEPANPESTDLYRFLDAAAGEGIICGDVDAQGLFTSLYPDAYERLAAEPAEGE